MQTQYSNQNTPQQVPIGVIFNTPQTVQIKGLWEQHLPTSVQKQIDDQLAQDKFFVFGKKLFKKVCKDLKLSYTCKMDRQVSKLNGAETAEIMLQAVPLELRPHFLKLYFRYLED
ncbi:MAG: hypothetical protein WCQ60_02835 [bacterium]